MKTLTVGLLFMGGLLMAQEAAPPQSQHLSENQRQALASQSPSVRVHKKHPGKNKYVVTKNKTTIVATKPYTGK